MSTMTRTKPTTKTAKTTRKHRAPAGPVGPVGPAATERAEAAAVELVEMLEAQGVKFAAPELAPSQIASSILAAWKLASDGPRDSDADFLLAVSGAVDGLAHAVLEDDRIIDVVRIASHGPLGAVDKVELRASAIFDGHVTDAVFE